MWWVAWWVFVMAIGAAGTTASINNVRFGRLVAREAREMAARSRSPRPVDASHVATLPDPVRRYLDKAIAGHKEPISRARVRHGGLFRPSLNGSWLSIRGEQYFAADPPAFIWWGRVRIAPGVWIDARDRSVDGAGNMFVTMESTVTMANSSGPEVDQGALLRLLGEIVWFPTAYLDERYVSWSALDSGRARATFRVNGRTVSGDFVFGPDDLPATFSADRYRDVGGGQSVLTPFVGRLSDFRAVDGVLVPFRVVGSWIVEGRTIDYVNFEVRQLEYEWTELR